MDEQSLANDLNELLALETRGLLRFMDDATPYLTARTFKAWSDVQKMARDTADHGRRLTQLLESMELPVRAASFETVVANYHYSTLHSLLPLLAVQVRRLVAVYQRAIQSAGDDQALKGELSSMLKQNQASLEKLESHIQALAPQAAPAGTT